MSVHTVPTRSDARIRFDFFDPGGKEMFHSVCDGAYSHWGFLCERRNRLAGGLSLFEQSVRQFKMVITRINAEHGSQLQVEDPRQHDEIASMQAMVISFEGFATSPIALSLALLKQQWEAMIAVAVTNFGSDKK